MTPSPNGADLRLPDDLAALERRLAERIPAATPTGLRERVLAAVRRELPTHDQGNHRRLGWRWLAGSAAAVLVALNFSNSIVNNMDWRLTECIETVEIAAAVQRVHALAPELSPQDARRHALLLRAGAHAAPAPHGSSSLVRILQQREHESWDMH